MAWVVTLLTYPSNDQNPVGQQHPSGCSHPDCAPDEQTKERHQRKDDRDVNEAKASTEPVTGRAGGDHGGGSRGSDNDRGHFGSRDGGSGAGSDDRARKLVQLTATEQKTCQCGKMDVKGKKRKVNTTRGRAAFNTWLFSPPRHGEDDSRA